MRFIKRGGLVFLIAAVIGAFLTANASNAQINTYNRELLKKVILKFNDPYFEKRFNSENIEPYLDALMEFQENGIEITQSLIEYLSFKKASSADFRSGLIKLAKAGIFENQTRDTYIESAYSVYRLTIEKMASQKYLNNIIRLHKHGIRVKDSFIEIFGLEIGEKDLFTDILILLKKLGKLGVNPDWYELREIIEQHNNNELLENFKEGLLFLKERGFTFETSEEAYPVALNKGFINNIADKKFREALIYFQKEGIWISLELVNALSREKILNKEARNNIIWLAKEGVIVLNKQPKQESGDYRHKTYGYSDYNGIGSHIFPLPMATDYDLHHSAKIIEAMDMEKFTSKKYVSSLIKIHKAGIEVNGMGIEALTLEKGVHATFVDTLIEIGQYRKNIKNRMGRLNMRLSTEYLTLEMAQNQEFISAYKKHRLYYYETRKEYLLRKYPEKKSLIDLLFMRSIGIKGWYFEVYEFLLPCGKECYKMSNLNELTLWLNQIDDIVSKQIFEEIIDSVLEQPIKEMNRLHERPDKERLKVIEGVTPLTLYYMTATARELYTSTLNLVSFKLKEELEKQKTNVFDLVLSADPEFRYFSGFVYNLARYGRLSYVMAGMNEDQMRRFFSIYVSQIEKSKNKLEHAFYLGAGFGVVLQAVHAEKTHVDLLARQLFFWIDQFQKESKKEEAALLQIIVSLYAEHFEGQYQEKIEKIREIYPLESNDLVDLSRLIDKKGVFHKRVYFYKGKDGRLSFAHFLSQRIKSGWQIEKREDFVILKMNSSGRAGPIREIRIYANRPEAGQNKLDDYLEALNIRVIGLTHRGHSYYTNDTLDNLTGREEMVFLGSCGGFQETDYILNKNLNTLIFSTANMGTMYVNDPLLDYIDQALLEGESNLRLIWQKAMAKIKDERKNGYIPPYENIGPKIYKAYKKYKASEEVLKNGG